MNGIVYTLAADIGAKKIPSIYVGGSFKCAVYNNAENGLAVNNVVKWTPPGSPTDLGTWSALTDTIISQTGVGYQVNTLAYYTLSGTLSGTLYVGGQTGYVSTFASDTSTWAKPTWRLSSNPVKAILLISDTSGYIGGDFDSETNNGIKTTLNNIAYSSSTSYTLTQPTTAKEVKSTKSTPTCNPITLGGKNTTNIMKYNEISGCFELDAVIQNKVI